MRKYLLLVILIIISSMTCRAQANKTHAGLTDYDKKHYILAIDQKQIAILGKIVTPSDGKTHVTVGTQVILSNNSNDTLKYINMTCGWNEAFTTNNKKINIKGWGCDTNFPTVYKISPHKSATFNFSFLTPEDSIVKNFRIGLYLIKFREGYSTLSDFNAFWHSKKRFDDCLIWSNEVTIPKQ